jgi:hypothetical protein
MMDHKATFSTWNDNLSLWLHHKIVQKEKPFDTKPQSTLILGEHAQNPKLENCRTNENLHHSKVGKCRTDENTSF